MCRALLAGVVVLLFTVAGAARADDEGRKKSEKLPRAVAAAVKSKFPKSKIVGVEKEDEDGRLVYEVKLRYKQGQLEVCLTPKGQVVKVEFDDDEDEHGDKKKGGDEKGKKKSKKGDDDDKGEKGKKKKDRDDDDKGKKSKKDRDDDDDYDDRE